MFRRCTSPLWALFGLFVAAALTAPARANTFTVTNTNDDGAGSLRQAMFASQQNNDADTIVFATGVFGTITLSRPLFVGAQYGGQDQTLTIQGPGADKLTINGAGQRVFVFQALPDGEVQRVSGLTLAGGSATGAGQDGWGGAIVSSTQLAVEDCVFSGNKATAGGAIYVNHNQTLRVTRTTFTSNEAMVSGGAIYAQDTNTYLTDCTLSGNTSDQDGGACTSIAAFYATALTATNCTFSGNRAASGGALRSTAGSFASNPYLTLVNSTVTGNTATTQGGGVVSYREFQGQEPQFTLNNTIVSGNTAGADAHFDDIINYYGVVVGDNNLVGVQSATTSGPYGDQVGRLFNGQYGNIVGVNDPLLAPLGDYGGPTQTCPPLPGSPAIDNGAADVSETGPGNTVPADDQRGIARPQNSMYDIGAVESQGFTIAVTGGSNQSTPMNTTFATALSFKVSSAFNEPVAGGKAAVFPLSSTTGASATIATSPATLGADGAASVTATANDKPGSYQVVAEVRGSLGNKVGVFNLTNTAPPGIIVTPVSGLITTEAGGTATFTVRLNSVPTANVVIDLSSSDTSEGTVSPARLTFTPATTPTPQTVTVTGVNDAVDDGDIAYTIVTGAAISADSDYSGRSVADVSVTNTDDDSSPEAPDMVYNGREDTTLSAPAPGPLRYASDPDGDKLTAVLVTGPSHGTLNLQSDGSFT